MLKDLVVIGECEAALLFFLYKGPKMHLLCHFPRPGWFHLLPDKSIPGSHPPRGEREAADESLREMQESEPTALGLPTASTEWDQGGSP